MASTITAYSSRGFSDALTVRENSREGLEQLRPLGDRLAFAADGDGRGQSLRDQDHGRAVAVVEAVQPRVLDVEDAQQFATGHERRRDLAPDVLLGHPVIRVVADVADEGRLPGAHHAAHDPGLRVEDLERRVVAALGAELEVPIGSQEVDRHVPVAESPGHQVHQLLERGRRGSAGEQVADGLHARHLACPAPFARPGPASAADGRLERADRPARADGEHEHRHDVGDEPLDQRGRVCLEDQDRRGEGGDTAQGDEQGLAAAIGRRHRHERQVERAQWAGRLLHDHEAETGDEAHPEQQPGCGARDRRTPGAHAELDRDVQQADRGDPHDAPVACQELDDRRRRHDGDGHQDMGIVEEASRARARHADPPRLDVGSSLHLVRLVVPIAGVDGPIGPPDRSGRPIAAQSHPT